MLERLSHPGLVRLLDTGLVDGQAYLVMELVEGPTLAAFVRRGPMAPAGVAAMGAQLADALGYVHACGIVHRDVKPSNILLSADGRARLGDFGISRLVDASTITVAGTTLGTVAYMAPEQLEDHGVGPAADVWSLAIVLLECLTGRRVYDGTPAEVVARRLAGPVPLPGDLPVPWRLLLTGMLDHRPEERLDARAVAALVSSAPYADPWERAEGADARRADAAGPGDLTALRPAATTTALLGDAPTRVARFAPDVEPGTLRPPGVRSRRRRWWLGALAVLVAAGTGAALAFGLAAHRPRSPGVAGAGQRSTTTTTVPATTTTVQATTTIPAGTAGLDTLIGDIDAATAAGAIDPVTGAQIATDARHAVDDVRAGDANEGANLLQQASVLVTQGVRDGVIDPGAGSTLQSDLDTLAGAVGLGVTTTAPATTPSGHGHGGAGHG